MIVNIGELEDSRYICWRTHRAGSKECCSELATACVEEKELPANRGPKRDEGCLGLFAEGLYISKEQISHSLFFQANPFSM
jgi:hypothetical protein